MKQYIGTFKDIKDNLVTVEIVPTQEDATETVPLKFTFDEPVVIEGNSDGIFTPIKDSQATISLFSDTIYWDIYTPSAVGYYVHIYNSTRSLFNGYLTPCIYTQDYQEKAQIELEAVDFIAVIQQFDYVCTGDKEIITVDSLISKLFERVPDYQGYINKSSVDFTKYYIQEANFFDDDNEPMNCQEILEELLKYLGLSATMYNGKVCFVDYASKGGTPETLTLDKYGDGSPTVELDEVYNKISIGCDLYEVDDLITDVIDKDNETIINEVKLITSGQELFTDYSFSWREHGHHTTDKHRYTMLIKPYLLADGTDQKYKKSRWYSYNRKLSDLSLDTTATVTSRANLDTNTYKDSSGGKLFVPQYIGAYPIRVYSYNKAEGMESKSKISWKDYILFPSLENKQTNIHRTTYPALTYQGEEKLAYSIKDGIGYLVFSGELWCQSDIGISGVDTDVIWTTAYKNGVAQTVAMPIPMEDMDLSFGSDIQRYAKRTKTESLYNRGWAILKAQLKIGDKYWNGSQWTTSNSTFWISYHDDDVNGDDETLNYFTWLTPAPNPTVKKYEVGQDGYAIPVTANDKLNGKLEFTLYTPTQLGRTINNFFIRDLKLEYVYKDSRNWADDKQKEQDIVYENIVDENYSIDMDEMDLKINSWYKDKPISKSYLLDVDKLPVVSINGQVQEANLLDKYYSHYSTPKKILNLNYKTVDMNPEKKYKHTQTNTVYMVDSYVSDIKRGETELKLIEV